MKRLLLDTNIYGELIFDGDFTKLKAAIQKKYVVHGFKVVRDELKAYHLVNNLEKKKTPNFIGYLDFKRWLI